MNMERVNRKFWILDQVFGGDWPDVGVEVTRDERLLDKVADDYDVCWEDHGIR